MAVNVFKNISACKVAPLLVTGDVDGLGRQKCPEELFRARRGFEQIKLNFLTTVADNWDGQTSTSGLFYEPFCNPMKSTRTDSGTSAQYNLEFEADRNGHASIGQKGKPRKFRPRKILRKLVGNLGNKVQSTSEKHTGN
ncbi:hypothetical protein KP79_PYT20712 [Mizuhopecten yessoensis]|uniref:Uncharacterized protein n=1 Tax=Mizuhopecten yessoensis TaxID=6573 RepID=A0A210PJL0_MIZYE|nr:hypothetical protein KP79_PYT20712 [Mizuhopecten yessoensis]